MPPYVNCTLTPSPGESRTQHRDDWPAIAEQVLAVDILVLGTPIWLGDKPSVADFTNRNTACTTHNRKHVAPMLRDLGGFAAYGNQRSEYDAGQDFDHPNREHR